MRRSILLLLFVATGCGIFDSIFGRDTLDQLRHNRGRWQALAITDYDFTYSHLCFCPYGLTRPMRISVRGGLVTSVKDSTGTELAPEYADGWPTIDSIFARTERDIIAKYPVEIAYNASLFFPSRVKRDIPEIADEEYTLTAGNLQTIVK
jgi:hypothetical protein